MKLFIKSGIAALIMASSSVLAAPAWYTGEVSRVALYQADGSFVITFKSTSLDDCMYKYAYFDGTQLGEGRLKAAYSMAITSLTAGVVMGVVIDKAKNGPGGICHTEGMTADLRAR